MSKKLLKLVFLLMMAVSISAQKISRFDQICERTSTFDSYKDLSKALKTADSLYKSAQNPLDEVKSLLLTAQLYHKAGDLKKSLCFAENANSLVSQINNPEWAAHVDVSLARQYRQVGLYKRSKKYILIGLDTVQRIVDISKKNELAGILNQEMAYYEIEIGNYSQAVQYIKLSLQSFEKVKIKEEDKAKAASYQLLGDIYFKLADYTVSENYYRKAEELLKEKSSCTLGLVYNGLGGIRLKQKNWKDADLYLDKAERIADTSRSLRLKKAVYSNINDYYEGTGDNYKASLYAGKYMKAYDGLTARTREFAETADNSLPSNEANGFLSIAKNAAIIILCAALIGLIISFRLKQKKQHSKFKNIIRTKVHEQDSHQKPLNTPGDNEFSNISVEEMDDKDDESNRKRNEPIMTSETETKLLELLEEFEKGILYNSKNMSLPFLAGELNTNTKYLSYVINQHKNADFKTYINRLRITYIVDKLINDEKYRQYKISILADECGFSSHSKFASVFKAVTDFSPSAYIKHISSDNQRD
ncbi:helix-turn-helix domain-containing protein [Chryseobacterium soli]|uniref:helix-turn-helix domain-containing protein n=1 Tax=Chryseobacterium soli TaxID=445961 RepID=UPI0029552581|nr:helix-turn-helix domain-containing protein [Chryseobacterium soli]MDV7698034.1 helix-turn-helix domain-containing protein [Chryseobacterium soli]